MMVVVLIADSLRADEPGFAGGAADTPVMDQLAAEGTRFRRAYASGAWTVPSLLAMTTGVFPHRLGVCRWRHPFPARQPTLLSAFAAAGFEVRTLVWNPRWAFGNMPHRGVVGDVQDPADVVDALRGPRGRDRLVLIHHWWTHIPYLNRKMPLDGWFRACDALLDALGREPEVMAPRLRALYRDTVRHLSQELLGRYLDAALSGGEDVLLVLTGDHGENWGEALPPGRRVEHVYDLHGRWFADSTLAVPLLWWGKGSRGAVPAGVVRDDVARGVDLAPTLCDMAGIPWPGPLPPAGKPTLVDRGLAPDGEDLRLDGRSLAGSVLGTSAPEVGPALTVSSHNAHVPHVYPADGRRMWRTVGLRLHDRWQVRDGTAGARLVLHPDGRRERDEGGDDEAWDLIDREWSRAVGPGPTLDRALFPADRRWADPDDDGDVPGLRLKAGDRAAVGADDRAEREELAGRMRMLGYLED